MNRALKIAERHGDIRFAKRILVIFAICDGHSTHNVAALFLVSEETILDWARMFLCYKLNGLKSKKPSGRKPKLTKDQKRELTALIDAGPQAAGFSSACWRSPQIQHLIFEKFGVFYNVFYISQLLGNLGFSFQKAAFVSDHLNETKRKEWIKKTFPYILALARSLQAHLLFGDEASFPQWGTLSYTWARKGQQPKVKTSGVRKGYKVLGLIDYFTGRFFYLATQERLNSETYERFLTQVLSETDKPIVLVQDGARYHTSAAMKKFFAQHADRLTVFQLPSYSPDFNPIEKLWKNIKQQETHMQYFPSFDSLKEKVDQALVKFANAPKEILALCGFAG